MKYNPYCKNLRTRIFDIETTGLYPAHDRIISASFCNCDGTDIVQFFCDAPQNEDVIIEQIIGEMQHSDVLVTYNGAMFDIPFVLQRAKKNSVAQNLPLFWSVDIYRWLKSYWPAAKQMESLRQKAVEEALGLKDNRTDEIGGGECISLYAEYVNWNNEEAKNLILLHNGDDVRQLGRICQKLSFLPYHQIAFDKGFLVKGDSGLPQDLFSSQAAPVITESSAFMKTKLSIKAKTAEGLMPADIYNDLYHLEYDTLTGAVKLEFFFQSKDSYKFINVGKIFTDTSDFMTLAGYQSGFLMLEGPSGIAYRECNFLAAKLIKQYF